MHLLTAHRNHKSKSSDRQPRLRMVLAILVAISVLTACGGGDGGSGADESAPAETGGDGSGETASPGDPCALLTNEEITAATGFGVLSSQRTEPSPGDSDIDICDWMLDGSDFESLRLGVYPPANARTYFDGGKEGTEPVAGLGEEAHWNPNVAGGLDVIDGDFSFFLLLLTEPVENRRPASEQLAAHVLTRVS